MTKTLSLDKALNKGWGNFRSHGAPALILWNLIFFISLFISFYTPNNETINIIFQIVSSIIIFYLSLAIYQVYLKAVREKEFESSDLIVSPKKIASIIGTIIILSLPVIVLLLVSVLPFLFLITVPIGVAYLIFISIYFSQSTFLILDKGKGPIQALSESFNLIKGNGFRYFLFMCCLGAINVVGILLAGIGLLFTGPLTEVMKAQLYVNLTK